MRSLRRSVAGVGALVVALLVALAVVLTPADTASGASGTPRATAPAADGPGLGTDPRLSVGAVTVSRSAVAVSGVATVPVTITARATYAAAPGDPPDSAGMSVLALVLDNGPLPPRPQSGQGLVVPLVRVAGTPRDGTWRGVAHIGSVRNGTLRVVGAWADPCFTCGQMFEPTPVDGPTIGVDGRSIPRIALTLSPDPVALTAPSVTLRATVVDSGTGRPYRAPVRVWFAHDNVCAEGEAFVSRATQAGVATLRLDTRRDKLMRWLQCAFVYGPATDSTGAKVTLVATGAHFDVTTTLTLTPAARSVRAGRPLVVRGRVAGAASVDYLQVSVQRLIGRSQWRTLVTAPLSRGAYTATVRSSTRGTLRLRAALVQQGVRGACAPVAVAVR